MGWTGRGCRALTLEKKLQELNMTWPRNHWTEVTEVTEYWTPNCSWWAGRHFAWQPLSSLYEYVWQLVNVSVVKCFEWSVDWKSAVWMRVHQPNRKVSTTVSHQAATNHFLPLRRWVAVSPMLTFANHKVRPPTAGLQLQSFLLWPKGRLDTRSDF